MVGLFSKFQDRKHLMQVLNTLKERKAKLLVQRIALGKASKNEILAVKLIILKDLRDLSNYHIALGQAMATHEAGGLSNEEYID